MTTPPTPPTPKAWPNVVADCVTVIVLGLLMYTATIDKTVGLLLIAFVIGAKMPARGGGVATLLWPALQFLRNGNGRWLS